MSSNVSTAADRLLDLNGVLAELVKQGRIDQNTAEHCLAVRRGDAATVHMHPLEYIASQQLDDQMRPGRKLDLETLTVWLAEWAGQPYLRIDPLKIDVLCLCPAPQDYWRSSQ